MLWQPTTLTFLDISFNCLEAVSTSLLDLPNLAILYLHGNSIANLKQVNLFFSLSVFALLCVSVSLCSLSLSLSVLISSPFLPPSLFFFLTHFIFYFFFSGSLFSSSIYAYIRLQVNKLGKLEKLHSVSFHGNVIEKEDGKPETCISISWTITAYPGYRNYVTAMLPTIRKLDFSTITPSDRQRADTWRTVHAPRSLVKKKKAAP